MKKIILLSMCSIVCIVMFSCTDDTPQTNPNNNTLKVIANDPTDGTINPPPITPPKP